MKTRNFILLLFLCWGLLISKSWASFYTVASYQELVEALAQAFSNRETDINIEFNYPADISSELGKAIQALRCYAPYEYWHYAGASWNYFGNSVTIQVRYRTTAFQEEELHQHLETIISSYQSLSPKEKVRAVHDWIINHVDYDTTYSRYTAYEAFFEQRAVCQGYSLLTYRMLTMLGLEVAIVKGYGNEGDHLWNMVKLCCDTNCRWFHLDVTWDDPLPGGMLRHNYFLLSDAEIQRDHIIYDNCGLTAPETYENWNNSCLSRNFPSVDVKINGSDGPLLLTTTDILRITVSLNPVNLTGEGDYFLWVQIPGGDCYCYIYPSLWRSCTCENPSPSYQGALFYLEDLEVFETLCAQLPRGSYTLYFAVDQRKDGLFSKDSIRAEITFQIK